MEAAKPVNKRLRTKYDAAFRAEAIRRVNQDGQAATHVAQALGMSEQVIASLSRPSNPYDNALAKSGWSTLKTAPWSLLC